MLEPGRTSAKLENLGPVDRPVLRVSGRLDVDSTPALWAQTRLLRDSGLKPSEIEASGVVSCDSAGAAWLLFLDAPVKGANRQVAALLELVTPRGPRVEARPPDPLPVAPAHDVLVSRIGHAAEQHALGFHGTMAYLGALVEGTWRAARHPGSLRRKDVLHYMTSAGADALPIVALISFLVGVIIAYQSAVQLHQYGADIYVADAVAAGVVMELGPLMTAIILAGRSGSAFAAEIGTMKVNEELDALDTMGLDEIRFLVMPKFLALLLMTPLLVTFSNFCGIAGGLLVGVTTVDLPAPVYIHETIHRLTAWKAAQGYIKGESYAVVIAAVGCLRGLQTKTGAQGVGMSATSAVVTSIFFIVVVDAALTVIFHHV